MPEFSGKSQVRWQFFDLLFGDTEGIFCLATTNAAAPRATFKQHFYEWPTDFNKIENHILRHESKLNVYFCVNLLNKAQRLKENCLATDFLWADLDSANPDAPEIKTKIPPGIVVASSPGRYQAYWRLTSFLPPFQAEDYSRRIAYYADADKSGWDLGQLMRVPFTRNFKYDLKPIIAVEYALETRAPPILFEALPVPIITANGDGTEDQVTPILKSLPTADLIIYHYAAHLQGSQFAATYSEEPTAETDWSKVIWKLIHICLEAGMSAEETLVIANSAPCNKYARDGRPIEHLWRDIVKAKSKTDSINLIFGDFKALTMPVLVPEPASETFIDEYREWASEATDAIVTFHDLCIFILLSALVSSSVKLNTSSGQITPNLWGLILGDSTLSRKTTSMRMVMDLLASMDTEMIVATDGSAEGLLSALADRPNKASIFYKDEVSGFFSSINRKDYLAGMPETLTALYDVPSIFSRRLRRETIHIESPAFVFFGGGVKDRVYDNITEEYILSGFMPRFLIVSGETDMEKLRRMGPPTEAGGKRKSVIYSKIADMYEQYCSEVVVNLGGQKTKMPPRISANLTSEAWAKYGEFEETLVSVASEVAASDLALPTFERLSRSMLKMAIILGAARQEPNKENAIIIEKNDVINAAWYVQDWGRYSVDIVLNAGKRLSEKMLDKILKAIERNPGILRSTLTRHYKLNKREADEILLTLEDRMLVRRETAGKGNRYWVT